MHCNGVRWVVIVAFASLCSLLFVPVLYCIFQALHLEDSDGFMGAEYLRVLARGCGCYVLFQYYTLPYTNINESNTPKIMQESTWTAVQTHSEWKKCSDLTSNSDDPIHPLPASIHTYPLQNASRSLKLVYPEAIGLFWGWTQLQCIASCWFCSDGALPSSDDISVCFDQDTGC